MRRGEEGVDVGADAEEGDVADVEQAREADHDVEPERQHGVEADARDHAHDVVVGRGERCEQGERPEAEIGDALPERAVHP